MGKNKLRKFAEMDRLDSVFQYPYAALADAGFPLRGRWHEHFGNRYPITVELGCGKGEYTVGLARRFPGRNFIGVDIKGARMWTGATAAAREGLANVAFIRTDIALIDRFFAPGEVDEIWITFPDPQMRKVNKRLTGSRFLQRYRSILRPGGRVNLKTDSPFLYTYTRLLVERNALPAYCITDDLYAAPVAPGASASCTDVPLARAQGNSLGFPVPGVVPADYAPLLDIRTFYEQQWLARGLTIKYIAFALPADGPLDEVTDDIPLDTYRSYSRGTLETDPAYAPATAR